MGTLLQDVRYGIRTLAKSPGFTIVVMLTLALGIGANMAIFSVLNAVLLRPLPYRDASRLVVMRETTKRVGEVSVSYPDFLDWRQRSRTFAQMAAVHNLGLNLSGVERPERIAGCAVSPEFLAMLGVRPALGRDLLPAEEKPGTKPVVLLSYSLWQSYLGGDAGAIGRTIALDGRPFTIIGVLPPGFRFLEKTDVIAPIGVWAKDLALRGERGDLDVLGRLAPGVNVGQARAEMQAIAANLARAYPETNRGFGVNLTTLREQFAGATSTPILVLFAAVIFVLLIACVNVANLFLVRGAERTREIALRLAIGATRGRVIRQILTESFLLAALGGGLGVVLGSWGLDGLARLLPADSFMSAGLEMDRGVFAFMAALVVLVAAAFGLAPALKASRADVQESLKEGGRGATSGAGEHRLRGVLVIAETALALVLLVGAGLMMKSLYLLLRVDPGFRPDRVVTMEIDLRSTQYSKREAVLSFWQQVLARVRQAPGIEAAAIGTVVPLTGNHNRTNITIEGQPIPAAGEFPHPDYHIVSSGFAGALGIPLLHGRMFSDADNESAPLVAMVNDRLARRFWPKEDGIGKRFMLGRPGPDKKWITVVGVVGDTKLYGLANPSRLEIYLPYRQNWENDMNLVVRSAADPASVISTIRGVVAAIDKDQPVFDVHAMRELLDNSVALRRLTLVLLGLFSGLALLLAAIGIYGVISYSVTRRTHEIGIRMAIGAGASSVLWLVLGYGLRLAGTGILVGVVAAFALTRLMSSLLFGIASTDPLTYAAVILAALAIALLACYIPGRRAMRVDPIVALRHE